MFTQHAAVRVALPLTVMSWATSALSLSSSIGRRFCSHIVTLWKGASRLPSESMWSSVLISHHPLSPFFLFPPPLVSLHAALKSPAAFHEQRRSLERARVSVFLKYSDFPAFSVDLLHWSIDSMYKQHGSQSTLWNWILLWGRALICWQEITNRTFMCHTNSCTLQGRRWFNNLFQIYLSQRSGAPITQSCSVKIEIMQLLMIYVHPIPGLRMFLVVG